MNKITIKNYRCFHDKQTARLAPLTLLGGENSTGKTSLMAMIRVLTEIAYSFRNPDFKEDPLRPWKLRRDCPPSRSRGWSCGYVRSRVQY